MSVGVGSRTLEVEGRRLASRSPIADPEGISVAFDDVHWSLAGVPSRCCQQLSLNGWESLKL